MRPSKSKKGQSRGLVRRPSWTTSLWSGPLETLRAQVDWFGQRGSGRAVNH